MKAVGSESDNSALGDALSALMNSSNTSNSIKHAAVYALGFSKADTALSTLFSILKLATIDLSSNSHGYFDEIMSSTIHSYCYSVFNKNYDINQNGEIETSLKLLQHPSTTISIATRHGLGRFLDITSLMKAFQSNHIHCYEALLARTVDLFVNDASAKCVVSTAALIEQYPDLLPIFVQELYKYIRYFTDEVYYRWSIKRVYN
ncbi:unnamed protein product [Rotaria magnacalcarata]|uniref:Uncharacterized protein n=1 Tax=Rotaria magnacalcarata TaxID=392030 RepID=A0A816NBI7_9BILA|nr:unnamed protein product [Rotaria magnacalcarata]CAF2080137.1 unnamed protein product [Rotaria magnacalcarata]CAF4183531.1 unnamed protein product [Rotaria magnacalcarata]CAF4215949.1 unnamed protein product [Rotaria magnacalcarata]